MWILLELEMNGRINFRQNHCDYEDHFVTCTCGAVFFFCFDKCCDTCVYHACVYVSQQRLRIASRLDVRNLSVSSSVIHLSETTVIRIFPSFSLSSVAYTVDQKAGESVLRGTQAASDGGVL